MPTILRTSRERGKFVFKQSQVGTLLRIIQVEAAEKDYDRVLDMTITETNAKVNNYKVSPCLKLDRSL